MKILLIIPILIASCLNAQQITGGKVNGRWSMGTPLMISGASASPDATTVVLQWTTNLPSNSIGSCGSESSPDNNTAPASTSHEVAVAGLAPSTSYTCTVQSGATTQNISASTTALASSTPITSVSIGTITSYNSTSPPDAMDGDTYYNCVSNTGVTYVLTADTSKGWSGHNVSAAEMVAKFTSLSPIVGVDVNALAGYGPHSTAQGPLGLSPKGTGLWCQGGSLFLALTNTRELVNPQLNHYGSFIVSNDHGLTWNNMDFRTTFWPTGAVMSPYSTSLWSEILPTNFASSTFVMYGADDGTNGELVADNRFDNANVYVYGISNGQTSSGLACWNNCDAYYLWRVPRTKIANLNPADYQFYVSGDGTLDSAWSTSQSSASAVITNVSSLSIANVEYIPALNRYLLLTFNYPSGGGVTSNTDWLIYESPHPWGPWTLIDTFNYNSSTTAWYNPIILQVDALNATLADTTMRILFTGNYGNASIYNLQYATMTVNH